MKKGILLILFFALTLACFATPVVATNTGPPEVVLSINYAESNSVARERPEISAVAFDPIVAPESGVMSVDYIATNNYDSEFVVKYRLTNAEKITLAALMSCALLALVSYLSSARYDVFDLRDRKQPLPMDQTAVLAA